MINTLYAVFVADYVLSCQWALFSRSAFRPPLCSGYREKISILQTVDINYHSHLNYLWSSNIDSILYVHIYILSFHKILVLMRLRYTYRKYMEKHSHSFTIDDGVSLSFVIHKSCCYYTFISMMIYNFIKDTRQYIYKNIVDLYVLYYYIG